MKKTTLPTTKEEIDAKLTELRVALHDVHANAMPGKRRNVHEGRMIRKDIARLMTKKTELAKA